MEQLKVRLINAYQLYRLLLEPEFDSLPRRSPATVRQMARRGVFGEPTVLTIGSKKESVLIDLRSAYGHYFSSVDKEKFVEIVNRWLHSKN